MSYLISDPLVLAALAILTGMAFAFLGARRIGGLLTAASIFCLYLFATPLVAGLLLSGLESDYHVAPLGTSQEPGAIVVLSANVHYGAPEYDGDTVGDMTLERMRYGALLHRRTGLPILVTGGMVGYLDRALGRLMADTYSNEFGFAPRWVEEASANTFQNAVMSWDLLKPDGIDRIYLVTHAWHMRRATASFRHAGFEVVPAPTGFSGSDALVSLFDLIPRSSALKSSALALHEWIGLLWYELAYL